MEKQVLLSAEETYMEAGCVCMCVCVCVCERKPVKKKKRLDFCHTVCVV